MQIQLRTGSFEAGEGTLQTTSTGSVQLDKKCLLVYCGTFQSMDGEVTIDHEHLTRLAETHNSFLSKLKMAVGGEVPVKHFPPVQLDHSTSAKDTVGRLVGELQLSEHQLEDGSKVPALYGTARILGQENVDRVKDGRWVHLSIGADLDTGKLSELTITPFPAAPEASMLSRKGISMAEKHVSATYKIEKYLPTPNDTPKWKYVISVKGKEVFTARGYDREDEALADCQRAVGRIEKDSSPDFAQMAADIQKANKKLTAEMPQGEHMHEHEHLRKHLKHLGIDEAHHDEHLAHMHKYLMDEHHLSEDEAHEHMAKMTDEHWDKYAAHMKHLATQVGPEAEHMPAAGSEPHMAHADDTMPKEPHANMAAQRAKITQLASAFKASMAKVSLVQAKARLSARLSAFKSTAQLTPAELKKFDIAKLSAKSSDFVEGVFHAIGNNDPKVFVGLHGTSKAVDVSKLSEAYKKTVRMSALEKEVRENMSSVSKTPGEDHMAEVPHGEKEPAPLPGKGAFPSHVEPDADDEHLSEDDGFEHLKKLIGEGKHDEAHEHFKKLVHSKHLAGDEVQPGAHEETHEEMKKLHAHFNELIKLTGLSGEHLA